MATKSMNVNAYLFFDGQCEAAFTFYEQALGGKITVMMRNGGTPAEGDVPADWADKILHARLELGGTVVMASDAPPGHYDRPQSFRVSLTLEDAVEAERIFHALEEMPLEKTFFAERFGMLIDRFGTPWMIGCEPQR